MYQGTYNMILGIVLFCSYCVLIPNIAQAQDTTIAGSHLNSEENHIKWISQFPSPVKKKDKRTINRIVDFLIGEKSVQGLNKPISILANNPDTLWIVDQINGTILKVQNQVGDIPRFMKKKTIDFTSLVGICSLPDNKILFTDSRLNKIFITSDDKVEVLNDTLELNRPTGIAYSQANDEIWVVETKAHRIAVLDGKGRLKKYIGSRGTKPGQFNFPTYIWIDSDGIVYVVDSMNFRVQIFDKDGKLKFVFGEMGDATGYFASPKGIATDSYGNIYVSDALFHFVQIFDKEGNFLHFFGGQGQGRGQFWMPAGIFIDSNNYIYIADSYNVRIQIFQLVKQD